MALAAGLLLMGCNNSSAIHAAGLNAPTGPSLTDSAGAERLIEGAWVQVAPDAGGYAAVPQWPPKPDLYQTAWNLCLAQALHLDLSLLNPQAVGSWALPEIAPEKAAYPPVYQALLAVTSLRAVGVEVPQAQVAAVLDRSRVGARYAAGRGLEPSWGATQNAVELIRAAGLQAPPVIADGIRSNLGTVTWAAATGSGIATSGLPIWAAADLALTAEERAPQRVALAAMLDRLQAELNQHGRQPSGPEIGELYLASQIASANGLPPPVLTGADLTDLAAPGGYLRLSADARASDPQVTCNAVRAGARLSPSLPQTVLNTMQPWGWARRVGLPDPRSSVEAVLILRASGKHPHEKELAALTLAWLRTARFERGEEGSTTLWQALYYTVALARLLGVAVPPDEAARLESVTADACGRPGALSDWIFATAAVAPVPLCQYPGALRPDDVRSAWLHHLAEPASRAADLGALRSGAAYRRSSEAARPDLKSTAAAVTLTGAAPESRLGATGTFAQDGGMWFYPGGAASSGNFSNLETAYLYCLLAGRTQESIGLGIP